LKSLKNQVTASKSTTEKLLFTVIIYVLPPPVNNSKMLLKNKDNHFVWLNSTRFKEKERIYELQCKPPKEK
jgi:hypothetical protein